MAKQERIAKTLEQQIEDLDAHMFLLRNHLHKLHESKSHLKVIAAELRTLVCKSSGREGLLWRLTQELGVDDHVDLHLLGKINQDHPLFSGLQFSIVPIRRAGKGDQRIKPGSYSLCEIIEKSEALVAMGKPQTHEYLIKAVAQQMGTAHEDSGLEPALSQLTSIFINGVEPFVEVLAFDAELTLEVGERVLEAAERKNLLSRLLHSNDYGNVSIVVRLQMKKRLAKRVQLFHFYSYISSVTIRGFATPTGIIFEIGKKGIPVTEFLAPYPSESALGEDIIAVFSYCSHDRLVRTITPLGASSPVRCELGWFHAAELYPEEISNYHKDMFEQRFLLTYERLLSTQEVIGICNLPSNGYGLWKSSDEIQAQGPFPE
jgi:hypothetical protein